MHTTAEEPQAARQLPCGEPYELPFSPSEATLQAMQQACRCAYNPGSQHGLGRAARRVLLAANEAILRLTHQPQGEVVYCGSRQEAWALALWGVASARRARDPDCKHILLVGRVSLTCMLAERLEADGFVLSRVSHVKSAVLMAENLALIAFCASGACFVDRASMERLTDASGPSAPPLFVDATNFALGEALPQDTKNCLWLVGGVELAGPAGLYALVRPRGMAMWPLYAGGAQMGGVRPGTEAIVPIAGLGAAADQCFAHLAASFRREADAMMAAMVQEALVTHLGPPLLRAGHRSLLSRRIVYSRPPDSICLRLREACSRTQLVAACVTWDGPSAEDVPREILDRAPIECLCVAWSPHITPSVLKTQLTRIARALAPLEDSE